MSKSRLLTLIGGLSAVLLELANVLADIGPPYAKYVHLAAVLGTFLAMFNERVNGGVSKLPVVDAATVVPIGPTTAVVPVAPVSVEQPKIQEKQ